MCSARLHVDRDLSPSAHGPARQRTHCGSDDGRRLKLLDRQVTVARQMHACGEHTISAIADILGVARFTVYRALGWDGDTGRLFRSGSEQARWMRLGAVTVPC
jgi:hypothetical protein